MMGSVDLSHIKAIKADFTQAPIALWRIHALIIKNVKYKPNSQALAKKIYYEVKARAHLSVREKAHGR